MPSFIFSSASILEFVIRLNELKRLIVVVEVLTIIFKESEKFLPFMIIVESSSIANDDHPVLSSGQCHIDTAVIAQETEHFLFVAPDGGNDGYFSFRALEAINCVDYVIHFECL